jgi:uncharacterized protein YjdB
MPGRFELSGFGVRALLLAALVAPFVGCGSSSDVNSITISPTTISLGVGATAQLTALATINHGAHPSSQSNITSTATWASSISAVASVSSSGVVTAVSAGTTTITASTTGFGGDIVSNTAEITVTGTTSGGASSSLASLAIIPTSQSVASPGQTSQFIAIGTTVSGATLDETSASTWNSSSQQVATITATGLATATGKGSSTISAIAKNADGSVVTATASFTVIGGASEPYTALTISPGDQSLSATGQTGQFIALATSGSTGLNNDVTNSVQVSWTSSIPTIATISSYPTSPAGLAAGVSTGSTTITAKLTNPDGSVLTATATVTVSATAAPEPLLSIAILPTTATIGNLQGTQQYLAYGTFSTAPTVQDITNGINHNGYKSPVTWISTNQTVFPVNSSGADGETGGLVTAYGSGTDDIYVVTTNPDGTLVYSPPATFNCPLVLASTDPTTGTITPGSCNPDTIASPLLVTLTVFNAGLNTTQWLITAPSATGTADVIHCGPGSTTGGSVCSATYPVGTTVTLTAPTGTGAFGGWSYNCTSTGTVTAVGPNSCTVFLGTNDSSNVSVGAIFN